MYLKKNDGFTLVELIFAMALFSGVLLVMTVGVISLFHIYQAGNEIRNTQQFGRLLAEDISRNTRDAAFLTAANDASDPGGRHSILCVLKPAKGADGGAIAGKANGFRYRSSGDLGLGGSRQVDLYRDVVSVDFTGNRYPTASDCAAAPSSASDKISTAKVSVLKFSAVVSPWAPADPTMITINMAIGASSGLDLLAPGNPVTCPGGSGSQYCSVTNIQTSAMVQADPGGGQ